MHILRRGCNPTQRRDHARPRHGSGNDRNGGWRADRTHDQALRLWMNRDHVGLAGRGASRSMTSPSLLGDRLGEFVGRLHAARWRHD